MKLTSFLTIVYVTGFLKVSAQDEVKLASLNSMERIGQQQELFGRPQAEVKAAKNETESFQVVIHGQKGSSKVVKAEITDLTGKNGTLSKDIVTLYRAEYTRVKSSTMFASLPPGLYTDPLIPFIDPYTGKAVDLKRYHREKQGDPYTVIGVEMASLPVDVWEGQNQTIWLDVAVPKNAAAGDYSGTFTVMLDTKKTFSIPVNLTVWDFTLPDGPTHRNSFGTLSPIAAQFNLEPNSEKLVEIERRYSQMMAQNRVNPPVPASLMPKVGEDGELTFTKEQTQALKNFIHEFNVNDFQLRPAPFPDQLTTNRQKAKKYYKDYYNYLKANGWHKKAYLYMEDEPKSPEQYQHIKEMGELVKEAAPDLKRLVVEQTFTENALWADIDPAVDIWCPIFACIDRKTIAEKLANGDEVWSYTALAQPMKKFVYHPDYKAMINYQPPFWAIDQPLTSYRVATWMNWQYKITGLLYWSSVYLKEEKALTDAWLAPVYFEPGRQFNGEGYLMYPGTPCGIEGPVASIRFKNIRDAMEDYEYFVLLENLAGREAVTKLVSEVAPEWWNCSKDPEAFIRNRELIATEILKKQMKGSSKKK